ncbi:beta-ketoacyl-[acyl-carrier-protein] synthase family protein [Leeia sp. TBRC 13508]|uniref:Beta-ketoacyl-[acyl-carrier-protein] synthase family protein n=1 Tax=Leeia speluncae TaxID=2884804 RepID=A0ABS8D3X7_9NEIS|nr:beta-ketoacyl-[acyl-carrier-protein] synthase family protein [Leeia speluncae]MCB6182905.1 beta-ketoacyl-[acyl-carrier-protein] synthase family protein [Leeia speluncae]
MKPLLMSSYTATSALGVGLAEQIAALKAKQSGIVKKSWETVSFEFCTGEVAGVDEVVLPDAVKHFDCRNNQLAYLALQQDGFETAVLHAITKYGPNRVAVLLGTSTSGILSTEVAYRERDPETGALPVGHRYRQTQNTYSLADFVRTYFGLTGIANVVSTACSSSAKVFAAAERLIECGLADAAIVGGVDSLCLTTIYGFSSLQLVSVAPCKPYDVARNGISIGEGAAFALLEQPERADVKQGIYLTGYGETSDAHHMSSPHPEGLGAQQAMRAALSMAGLTPAEIGYINLHGTATPSNDAAEGKAVTALFGKNTPCSSTKGHTGHTLGAAGGLEAIFSAIALTEGFLPAGVGTTELDPDIACHYLLDNQVANIQHVLTNSFGFGGSNCSLIFSKG